MQYDPRHSTTPPSPIEPTGFFTGIQFRPIIGGVIVDTIASIVLTTLYYSFFIAKELAAQGDAAEDALSQYWSSSEGLMASLLLGSLGTVIGGSWLSHLPRRYLPALSAAFSRKCSRALSVEVVRLPAEVGQRLGKYH